MILLDQRVSDLVRGYDRVSQADLSLQTEWRQHLLQHYASRRDKHASAFSEYVEKIRVLNPQLSTIAFVPLAMLIGGLVVTIVGVLLNVYWGTELTWGIGGVSLLIAGAIGIGLPIILWLWQVKLAKPPPPVHPLQEDLWSRFTPQWRAKLHGKLPVAILQRGNAGIYSFVKHLNFARGFNVRALHSPAQGWRGWRSGCRGRERGLGVCSQGLERESELARWRMAPRAI